MFKTFLEEAYSPLTNLVRSEENKQNLMKLGVTKKSTLERISPTDARENKTDLLLFINTVPAVEKIDVGEKSKTKGKIPVEAGDVGAFLNKRATIWDKNKTYRVEDVVLYKNNYYKNTVDKNKAVPYSTDSGWVETKKLPLKTKALEKIEASEKHVSIIVGYIKGDKGEVFRTLELGQKLAEVNNEDVSKAKPTRNIRDLYVCDLIYRVVPIRKELLTIKNDRSDKLKPWVVVGGVKEGSKYLQASTEIKKRFKTKEEAEQWIENIEQKGKEEITKRKFREETKEERKEWREAGKPQKVGTGDFIYNYSKIKLKQAMEKAIDSINKYTLKQLDVESLNDIDFSYVQHPQAPDNLLYDIQNKWGEYSDVKDKEKIKKDDVLNFIKNLKFYGEK